MRHIRTAVCIVVLSVASTVGTRAQAPGIPHPTDYFGFEIGTDGELARYPRILEYLRLLADRSDRVTYERRGTTTLGHPYVMATISAPRNLARLDRLVEINHRLNDPRGLSEADAMALAREGVPFYFLYATIHATEVGTTQTVIEAAHRLATERSPEIAEILDNVVLLVVPSQNPDGQHLVIDHWYDTRGTGYDRTYPDLYHHYTGHDDNRDWFMFTQKETRLALDIHRELKPQVTHDMHQMGPNGARMFVPPYRDPHDPNIHSLLLQGQARIGMAMAAALAAENKKGVVYGEQYDLWAPARQYMVYHGQPRILTELASARLADPYVNPAGADVPSAPRRRASTSPRPTTAGCGGSATSSTTGSPRSTRGSPRWRGTASRGWRTTTGCTATGRAATRRPTRSSSPPSSGTPTRRGSCWSCCTPARSRSTAPAPGSPRAGGAFRPGRG